ncbi:prolyl oligopeptidase family serine peptidase [Sphingomonas jaspsi]|uniref:prolyl oligopeptidase family serine peptidase n=1 Tax=Sphingomonas jaspsi TaxID=392409 RepID=UPI00056564F0|nr:prolyl oligopeptidase family serine peptidase [Sphingomonas jaspsi]
MRNALPVATLLLASACATVPPAPPPPPELTATEMPKEAAAIQYPQARKVDLVEDHFGTKVADPYRWLENDVRTDAEVAKWVEDENKVTNAFLETLPLRAAFKERMTALYDYERYGLPRKFGNRYFYTHNSGLQNQSVLFYRDGLNGEGKQLIDPNGWSADGATALAEWTPSEDGRLLAYSVQDGGTDWRSVKVMDVATGKILPDELKWLKYSGSVSWAKDGSGFYYSRFPEPEGHAYQESTFNNRVYFHKLGTAQAADRLVYATPDHPKYTHYAAVTDDGRYLVISTSDAGDQNDVAILDLKKPGAKPRPIFTGLTNEWYVVGNEGSRFFFQTDKDAPLKRVVSIDLAKATIAPTPVIAEQAQTLTGVGLVGGRLIANYLVDAKSEDRVYDVNGKLLTKVALPGIGSTSGYGGRDTDSETFFSFNSYNRPATIYRYDVRTGHATEWAAPKLTFDPDAIVVEQRFYASKDGTRVPMFIVRRKDVTGPAPTMLYGYGGFNISLTPGFSAPNLAWVEKGGIFVVANLRGGGEYGNAWHDGGRLQNKQNVFDDFIAAAEYLKANGISTPKGLSAIGRSNGGLLIGAVTNQRPDLFDAVSPGVGVMDMIRFDQFTAGRFWVDDYGVPAKEADFRTQLRYSPYHNIKGGRAYPPLIAVTADTDDRVVPGHTFKYIARLQAEPDVGTAPHLVRIETRAGHGSGKPVSKIIDEYSDVYAFLGHFTGLDD